MAIGPKRREDRHKPRPVIWGETLWQYVRSLRTGAEVLRRIHRHTEAAAHDAETDRLVEVILQSEGDEYVTTAQAVEITRGAKPQTIRSWARRLPSRRPAVRTLRRGSMILYHRDDLLQISSVRSEAA